MTIITDLYTADVPSCVATIGFFDGVHCGHRFLINQVKEVAAAEGLPTALITFALHPRKVMQKEYQPLLLSTPQEKLELLAATGVDYCIVLDFTTEMAQLTARQFMESVLKNSLHVHTLVIGYDHRFGHNRSEGFTDYCVYGQEMGMRVVRAKEYSFQGIDVSSSSVRSFLLNGEVEKAACCLERNYRVEGVVVEGYRIGRTIGFPTANIKISNPDKLIPADGVYAVRVEVSGSVYGGMLDIGTRPTFGDKGERTIEVHLLDFSADIYGQSICVEFISRIRSNIRFESGEELMHQLKRDEAEVRRILHLYI